MSEDTAAEREALARQVADWAFAVGHFEGTVLVDFEGRPTPGARNVADAVLAALPGLGWVRVEGYVVGDCARCGKPILVGSGDAKNRAMDVCMACTVEIWREVTEAPDA